MQKKKRQRRTSKQLLKDESLIFIDTNIFLDFYRMRTAEPGMKWLSQIESNLGRIISTCQIEMEFKKNRQKVILETKKNFGVPKWDSLNIPPILMNSAAASSLKTYKGRIKASVQKINKEIVSFIEEPNKKDPIYTTLEGLFKHSSEYILGRQHPDRRMLKHKSRTRFGLGYPPKKGDDFSYGDSLNWEWIIWCAKKSGKPIIIVSRDSDYGHEVNGSCVLNTWLKAEFMNRVGPKRSIVLTNRLAAGFKLAGITLPAQAVKQEEDMIASQVLEKPKDGYNETAIVKNEVEQ
ncbi:MAG: PIN domain-containing protein [Oligoflexus sp.]